MFSNNLVTYLCFVQTIPDQLVFDIFKNLKIMIHLKCVSGLSIHRNN